MSQPSPNEAALIARARHLASLGKSQRQIAAAVGKPRHWVRYQVPTASASAPSAVNVAPGTALRFHPLANLFPLIEGEDFAGLVASIKANGLRDAIVILDGMILDGRNRQRACEAAEVECRYEPFPSEADPLQFVIDKNLFR